jgi:hypothetical protein
MTGRVGDVAYRTSLAHELRVGRRDRCTIAAKSGCSRARERQREDQKGSRVVARDRIAAQSGTRQGRENAGQGGRGDPIGPRNTRSARKERHTSAAARNRTSNDRILPQRSRNPDTEITENRFFLRSHRLLFLRLSHGDPRESG